MVGAMFLTFLLTNLIRLLYSFFSPCEPPPGPKTWPIDQAWGSGFVVQAAFRF
jgi:hypothetical protein